jgi:hypothetical protein
MATETATTNRSRRSPSYPRPSPLPSRYPRRAASPPSPQAIQGMTLHPPLLHSRQVRVHGGGQALQAQAQSWFHEASRPTVDLKAATLSKKDAPRKERRETEEAARVKAAKKDALRDNLDAFVVTINGRASGGPAAAAYKVRDIMLEERSSCARCWPGDASYRSRPRSGSPCASCAPSWSTR